jgi:predicted metalloprotease with PDZ domain
VIRKAILRSLLITIFASAVASAQAAHVQYTISLKEAAHQIVNVSVVVQASGPEADFQLPVWNALYQVRDFAKNVLSFTAHDRDGNQLAVRKLDKTTWRVSGFPAGESRRISIDYRIIADQSGPFGAQVNKDHAFLNLAEVLVYPVEQKDRPITLTFADVPQGWKLTTPLPASGSAKENGSSAASLLQARSYDHVVDSPCELGGFHEFSYEQSGATFRVAIDGDPKDYNSEALLQSLRRITAAETEWMHDRPFQEYLFIYHIPRGPAGGGMEHAYSTAIGISASSLRDLAGFNSVSAHEFFHLWNVKRIRPQSLEPVDYARENFTRALWFSEGVTNTVAQLILVKAGLLDEKTYLARLASAITTLQNRPAHRTQSAEESSLDAWFDGYPNYRLPERSINYYNKGEILGALLDLKIRQETHGQKSLRDLFRYMNENYAKQGKFFADSEGIRRALEAVTGADFKEFFRRYVAGTEELPYEDLFATAGLHLNERTILVPDAGFSAFRNFDGPMIVVEVTGESAVSAGVQVGDEILEVEGQPPVREAGGITGGRKVGDTISLTVRRGRNRIAVRLTLAGKEQVSYEITPVASITTAQQSRRQAWVHSEDEGSGATFSGETGKN